MDRVYFDNKWIIKNSTGSQKAQTKVNNDKDCIKILLPVLCQFSHNSLNSIFQTPKEAGKLLEVHPIFWEGNTPQGTALWADVRVCACVCVRVSTCRSLADSASILETYAAETFLSYLLFPALRR